MALPQIGETLEDRVLLAAPTLVKIASTNTGSLISTDPSNPDTLPIAPEQFTLTFNPGQIMDVSSARTAITVTDGAGDPVNVGFIGAGASPEEIVVRFAENLIDGSYSINIDGTLQNAAGEAFNDGGAQSVPFNLDLGAQVVAVVPQPVNTSGTLSQARNQIVVYFNNDDLDPALANSPEFYQLINAEPNPANPNDLVRMPTTAVYDSTANTTTLTFAVNIEDTFGAGESLFRLRIGTNESVLAAQAPTNLTASGSTSFGYGVDEDSDGVEEFVDLTFHLADPVPGTSQDGKPVQITITSNPGAAGPPAVTANVATGQISIALSGLSGSETTLSELLGALASDPLVGQLIRVEVRHNSNLAAAIGASFSGTEVITLSDAGSSFRTGHSVGDLGLGPVTVSSAIEAQAFPFDFPGALDEPGQRELDIFRFVPSFDTRFHPSFVDEPVLAEDSFDAFPFDFIDPAIIDGNGVETLFYNFQSFVGLDPDGLARTNVITENQKQRVREVFDFYANYLGVQFVETANRGFTIARSDMRVLNPEFFTGANDGLVGVADPARQLAILDSGENWNDTFGDYTDPTNAGTVNFFEEAMEVVGLLLGLGNTDHAPGLTVQGQDNIFYTTANANLVELDYPGDIDIVGGKVLHPPESKDIDLYRFVLPEDGVLSAQVFAERLTGSDTSLLDATLRLYSVTEATPGGVVTESALIAQNDDYFSEDSFLELSLEQGVYFIGVSASGNDDYDPTIADTGINGRTQGKYELQLDFKADVSSGDALADTNGTIFDGDHDGVAGGVTNFWFTAAPSSQTFFVDRSEPITPGSPSGYNVLPGTGERVYNEIDRALSDAAALPGTIVRIVGNDAGLSYEIGRDGGILRDGSNLEVPKGVTVMIDAGAILKFKDSRISVGSFDQVTDRSDSALQVLGVPGDKVIFTSWLNEDIGTDTTPTPTIPANGDWGGIVFQENIDREAGRTVLSDAGAFLNYVAFGEFTYGGGRIDVGGIETTVNPIHAIEARPTILNNTIVLSNDSAISADPDSFEETRYVDYVRTGPEIYGNILSESTDNLLAVPTADAANPAVVQNASNGLFIRVLTPAGNAQTKLTVSARFDDTDIAHILTENLEIQGTAGGRIDPVAAPNLDPGGAGRTVLTSTGVGDLPEGSYSYRMTFVTMNGNVLEFESPPSDPSETIAITGDPTTGSAIRLNNLPTATGAFNGRRLYRSHDGVVFTLVGELNASTTNFVDDQFASGPALDTRSFDQSLARYDASLVIDPGILIKAEDAAIQVGIGANLIAEGQPGREIIFTSRKDDSFGAGGTFDTNDDASVPNAPLAVPGDWGGIYVGHLSSASISDALITFGGGSVPVPGGFATFNALEIHQAQARIVNTILENNLDGTGGPSAAHRFGRGANGAAVIFVRGAQPVFAGNTIRHNEAPALNINANALNNDFVNDWGRSRGEIIQIPGFLDNQGPLIVDNIFDGNSNNGMLIRGEVLTTQSVWDDTGIVHVLDNEHVVVPDVVTFGGLRLESSATQSLVVKLAGDNAGFTAVGRPLDIEDRIGGVLHIVGQPGKPVVLTSLNDDTIGAGFNSLGLPQNDTNGNGIDANNDGIIDTAVDADADGLDDVTGLSITIPVAAPGDWGSVTIDQFAHDRNVRIHVEGESRNASAPGPNGSASAPESLGDLAPLEDVVNAGDLAPLTGPANPLRGGGDDSLRLGFQVEGVLNTAQDIDVYSFGATAGSEVWLDIDLSEHSLDTVIDLLDLDDNILASTDSTLAEQTGTFGIYEQPLAVANGLKANTLNKSVFQSDDFFSTNQRDAGMRVVLPGARGQRGTFYVRVRSSNVDSLDGTTDRADLLTNTNGGLTAGAYQLQVRLQEEDETAGSTVRYADIRFAEDGIRILGQPTHSPLQGEFSEAPGSDVSNSFGGAPDLGNVLSTDQGSISISAALDREDDLDWFRFDVIPDSVRDDEIENPAGVLSFEGGTPLVFDLDYADDNGGGNTRLSIFNSAGQLIFFSDDSNIIDDRPAGNEPGGDADDISRGSIGAQDPYIGPVELPAGTYYAVVSSKAFIPNSLEYLLQEPGGALDEVRVEPINSIVRIADERFDFGIDPLVDVNQATADVPITNLFDEDTLLDTFFSPADPTQPNRVPWDLSDVALYVSTDDGIAGNSRTAIRTIDGYSGVTETVVGPRVGGVQPVGDIAMRHDGELFGFATGPVTGGTNDANSGDYLHFNTGDGARSDRGGSAITTWFLDAMGAAVMGGNNNSGFGMSIEAIGYYSTGDSSAVLVGHRNFPGTQTIDPMNENILFSFNVDSGRAANTAMDISTMNGFHATFEAGTNRPAIGFVDTTGDGSLDVTGGLSGQINGIAFPDFGSSRGYGITDAGGLHVFDLFPDTIADNGSVRSSFLGDIGTMIGRPGIAFEALAAGPDDIEPLTSTSFQGRYEDILFAVSDDGLMVAIDISQIFQTGSNEFTNNIELAPIFVDGQSTIQLMDEDGFPLSGVTGLDFGTLTRNLWQVDIRHGGDVGHGAETPFDFSRSNLDDGNEGSSVALHFGNSIGGSTAGNKNDRGRNNTISDTNNLDFPNGAHGSIISNEFDLSPYTSQDKPSLQFNYYLQTENTNAEWVEDTPSDNNPMRDSFRVFVGGDDGVWNLVATNNSLQPTENVQRIDEFDYAPIDASNPLDIQEPITDGTGSFSTFPLGQDYPDVVELYDDSNFAPGTAKTWYAAFIDLSSYAGRDDLRLRFDFSTAGGMDFADGFFHTSGVSVNDVIDGDRAEEIRAVDAFDLQDGERFETDGDGNFTDIDAFNLNPTTAPSPTGEHFEFDFGHVFAAPSGSSIADGTTFSIDGETFQFVKGSGLLNPNSVVITDGMSGGDIAETIATVVNASATLTGVTAIAVGNRVNFVGATDADIQTSALVHSGTPGVRDGHHAVNVTLDMDRAAVALSIKTTMASVFFTPLTVGIPEIEPNSIAAEAQSLENQGWELNRDANIGDLAGVNTSQTIPHISVSGTGDGTLDLYSFTATAGSRGIFDIDATTNGLDTNLRVLDAAGVPISGANITASQSNTFPLDPGSTPFFQGSTFSRDALLEVTFPADGTYIIEVSQFGGTIPTGTSYVLHTSIENHVLDFDASGNPRSAVDTEPNEAGSEQPLDSEVWSTVTNPDIFATGDPHVTVQSAGDATASVDRYTFTVPLTGSTGNVIVDIDNTIGGLDASLQVFDSVGTLVASNLDGLLPITEDVGSTLPGPDPILIFGFGGIANGFEAALTPGETYTIEIGGAVLGSDIPAGGGYDLNLSVNGHAAAVSSLNTTFVTDATNIKGFHQQGFIKLVGHDVTNNGPLGWSNTLPGDEFGAFGVSATSAGGWNRSAGALRGVNNRIEGVWVDDIVIGVAERGQMVTNAPANNTGFRLDTRIFGTGGGGAPGTVNRDHLFYTGSPNSTDQLTGPYTLEIRRASEFAVQAEDFPIKTHLFRSFDATDRLSESITLVVPTVDKLSAGTTFVLSDGIDEITFEYVDISSGSGASGNNIAIPIDPLTDGFNANSDEVVAETIAAILNSTTVQAILDLTATAIDNRVEIFGDARLVVAADPTLGVTGRIAKNVESTHQVTAIADAANPVANASLGPFDTFQIENTSTTESITSLELTLPEGQFFDLRDTFVPGSLPGFPLFEGSDPALSAYSDDVGAMYFSDATLTTPLQEGDRTAFISFTNFGPGSRFHFNIGVSHYIDEDALQLLTPEIATADSGSRHLIDTEVLVRFDSNRQVTAQFMDSRLTNFDNGRSEAVLASSSLDITIHDLFGDRNVKRQQGQIVIESNTISDSEFYGIVSGPGVSDLDNHDLLNFAPKAGVLAGQGDARNSIELNDLGLVPGIVIENNILVRGGTGGIDFSGDLNGVAPFGRIVNNTILGGSQTTNGGGGNALTFDGITFPAGISSFADSVVQYGLVGTTINADPLNALGAPDGGLGNSTGLGDGGFIILEFVDNILVPSGDSTADLHVFEVGSAIEIMQVEISEDAVTWIDLGTISGQPSSLDIDAAAGINPAGLYRFVRITDDALDNPGAAAAGADIDAVGAISSVPTVTTGIGSGITVRNNASPTVLNNAIVSLETGIFVDNTSTAAGTVIGANLYVDNVNDHGGVASYGTFDASDQQAGNPDWTVGDTFVDVSVTNLYPAAGSPLIDSSLDSLADRAEVVTLRDPLGIAASPVLAPDLDAFGQTRGDDDAPGTGPGAPGANVRKDRGAIDRVDFESPEATVLFIDSRPEGQVEVLDEQERRNSAGDVILAESDTAIGEIGRLAAGAASAVRQFVLRFDDIGVGIDDAPILLALNDTTGTIPLPFTLTKDGQPLVAGTDYIFVWNSNTDEAIFTHVTEFPLEANYTIIVDNDPAFGTRSDLPVGTADPNPNDGAIGIRDLAGNFLAINQPDGTTQFEILLTDGINDPPINAVPLTRQSVNEDQTLVFGTVSGNPITVSDADVHLAADPLLTVTLTATNGVLTLGSFNNITFPTGDTGTAETSITIEGSVADLNTALDGLQFTPTAGYFNLLPGEDPATNPDPATITVTSNDGGRFAPGNIPESDSDVILVDVLSINDPPTFDTPVVAPAPVDEDSVLTGPISLITGITTGSPSESSQRVEFTVTVSVVSGNIAFTTPPAISPTGALTYVLAPDTNGTAELSIVAADFDDADPGHVSAVSSVATVDLVVNPINDAPIFVVDNSVDIDSVEDQGPVGPLTLISSYAAGPAAATDETTLAATIQTPVFAVSNVTTTAGNLALDNITVVDGVLNYEATANTSGTVTFDLTLMDDGPSAHAMDQNTSAVQTITINVAGQPDAPVPVTPDYLLDEGDVLTLDASGSTDVDLAFATIGVTEALSYSWDLNNNGTFDIVDSPDAIINVPYGDLEALGLTAPGSTSVTLRVTDTYSGTSVDTTATLDIVTVDYGDAPDSYGTLKASSGAVHTIVPGLFLGAGVDKELNGFVPPAEDGADEDGIVFVAGMQADASIDTTATFTATASAAGKLDIWIDFSNDGIFQPGEHLNGGTSFDLVAGENEFSFDILAGTAVTGVDTWARARFSSAGSLTPTGRATDGEVEDYKLQISPLLDAVGVEAALPMWSQTSDLTPLLQWQQLPGTPAGANATYNVELRNSLNQLVGFEENYAGDSIQIGDNDPLPPGSYTLVVTPFNKAGVAGPVRTLRAFEVVAIAVTAPAGNIAEPLPTISWTPIDQTDHYEIEITSATSGALVQSHPSLTGTSFDLTTPLAIGSYNIRVRAFEATTGQVGDWSVPQTVTVQTTPVLTAPIGTITDATPVVTWGPVSGAATYDVRINAVTDNISPLLTLTGINATSTALTNALPLGEYTIEVRGVSVSGQASDWSPESTFIVGLGPVVNTPTGRLPDATPTVSWFAVDGADTYDLEFVQNGQVVLSAAGLTDTLYTTLQRDALSIGPYQVRITANNLPAAGSTGSTVSAVSLPAEFSVTAAPEVILPNVVTYDTTPEITWTLPIGTSEVGTTTELEIFNVTTNAIEITRTGISGTTSLVTDTEALDPGEYRIRVRSTVDNVVSDWSTAHVIQIGAAPVALGPSNGLGTAPFTRTNEVRPTLTAQQSLAGVTHRFWLASVTSGQAIEVVDGIPSSSYTVAQDLTVGKYRYWVQATTGFGEDSAWSRSYDFEVTTTPVMTPVNPTFDRTPVFTWNNSADSQQAEITSYQIWLNKVDVIPAQVILNPRGITGNQFDLADFLPDGLENGRYKVWIRGFVEGANGSVGQTVTGWSNGEVFEVGGRPTVNTPSDPADNTPLITWSPVDGAESYELYLAAAGSIGSPIVREANLTTNSYQVTDQLGDGEHFAWVRAISTDGEVSPWSLNRNSRFSINPVSKPTVNAVPAGNDTTPTFTWSSATGAVTYEIFVSSVSSSSTAIIRDATIVSTTYTSNIQLSPGDFRVWVRAIGATGTSDWSDPVRFTVVAQNDTQPLEVSDDTILVSLQAVNQPLRVEDVTATTAVAKHAEFQSKEQRAFVEVPVHFEADSELVDEDSGVTEDAEESDRLMSDWDDEIWAAESAGKVSTPTESVSEEETIAPTGWMAGLALLAPSVFRKRKNDKKRS